MVVFFCRQIYSKLFELLFLAKKQQWEERGVGYGGVFLSPNIFQKYLNYFSWPKNQQRGERGIVVFFCRQMYFKNI